MDIALGLNKKLNSNDFWECVCRTILQNEENWEDESKEL